MRLALVRGPGLRRDVPWQQFLDVVDRMFGDLAEDVTQVCLGVEPVQLRRPDQTIDDGCPLATVIGTG